MSIVSRKGNCLIYFYLFTYFIIAVNGLSLVAVSGGYSLVAVRGLLVCGGFSCCRAPALGLWASVLLVGLSCPEACGILVLGPGIKSTSPALAGGFLTTGPLGKSPGMEFSLEITGLYLLEIQPVLM